MLDLILAYRRKGIMIKKIKQTNQKLRNYDGSTILNTLFDIMLNTDFFSKQYK